MNIRQFLLLMLNIPLKPAGILAVPSWERQWWRSARSFSFRGREYPCFYHAYNCGWPPYVSERTVELALADAWLSAVEGDVIEIGAVTPYYWPGRVAAIIDPYDPHPLITQRQSMFDIDLTGRTVLAISTFEHIGTDDYSIDTERKTSADALLKLFAESPSFLVTVPLGYSASVDGFLPDSRNLPPDVSVWYLRRTTGADWAEVVHFPTDGAQYGDPKLIAEFPGTCIGRWANAVAVLERGNALRSAD